MSYDESARCYKCDQEKGTHDDGECEAVTRSMSLPAAPRLEDCEHGVIEESCTQCKANAMLAFKLYGEPNGRGRLVIGRLADAETESRKAEAIEDWKKEDDHG